ncbi:lipopolysaccharide biosynthesis protein [Pantoea cypripedii]|uniref:Flippase n=1 Tax=Pantoea cypripedii TaxID=55209 RepID=A0A6B9G3T9_PANCY|nr:lipopolysaccharide biosynthesis protein [Pantoea cypripedii]QGY32301.1 flippase [Pantoea cypripedii]
MNWFSNAKWNAFSQFIKMITQAVNLIYITKLILPSQYGLMAMAVVVINLGMLLRDLGTSAAIIQKKKLNNGLVNSIFWLNSMIGVLLYMVIILIAKPLAALYEQPELFSILILLGISFPLSGLAATHLALLERSSKFKTVSRIEVTAALTSMVIALAMANYGFGVYSLVAQAITLSLISVVQLWIVSNWRPTFDKFIRLSDIKEIFSFSTNLSLFSLVNYFSRNADSFIVGKYMSSTILGQYNLAYRIMLFPLQSLTFVVTRSLYPILSMFQDENKQIEKAYLNSVFFILMFSAPLMIIIGHYSFPLIKVIFGNEWIKTAEILKWLSPTAIVQSIMSTSGAVFMAKGRTDMLMRLGLFSAAIQVSSFLIGVHFDIITFSKFYFIANVISFIPSMYFLMKIIGGGVGSLVVKLMPIIFAVIGMLALMQGIDRLYPDSDISGVLTLTGICIFNFSFYFLCLLSMSRSSRRFMFDKLRLKLGKI